MIKKLNKNTYLQMSIAELEQRLEMQSVMASPSTLGCDAVSCTSGYCETWDQGVDCDTGYGCSYEPCPHCLGYCIGGYYMGV